MTQRDELAELIYLAQFEDSDSPFKDKIRPLSECPGWQQTWINRAAGNILAAGFSKTSGLDHSGVSL
jgi:hypothetical protein